MSISDLPELEAIFVSLDHVLTAHVMLICPMLTPNCAVSIPVAITHLNFKPFSCKCTTILLILRIVAYLHRCMIVYYSVCVCVCV